MLSGSRRSRESWTFRYRYAFVFIVCVMCMFLGASLWQGLSLHDMLDASTSAIVSVDNSMPPPILPMLPPVSNTVNTSESVNSAFFLDVNSGSSSAWAPLTLTACLEGMPSNWAPCLAQGSDRIEEGQELIYQDFSIALPHFDDAESREILLQHLSNQNSFVKDDRVFYQGQHGQNLVIKSGVYTNDPPIDEWSESSCMGADVLHQALMNPFSQADVEFDYESAILATSPNSWSFQHFLDRVTHVVEQAANLSDNKTVLVTASGRRNALVPRLLTKLGYDDANVHRLNSWNTRPIRARRFIFSCRAPLVHPYFALRFSERVGVRHLPMSQRKVVLFLSRKSLSRSLDNEHELVVAIKKLLKRRGEGERLMMLSDVPQDDVNAFVDWMGANVRALVGAHGGAFYNHRFCGKDTLVLEMMPSNRIFTGIWEEAELLSQNYWMPILHSDSVEVNRITDILQEQLGIENRDGKQLQHQYRWKTKP